jgi:hypothetical protein
LPRDRPPPSFARRFGCCLPGWSSADGGIEEFPLFRDTCRFSRSFSARSPATSARSAALSARSSTTSASNSSIEGTVLVTPMIDDHNVRDQIGHAINTSTSNVNAYFWLAVFAAPLGDPIGYY